MLNENICRTCAVTHTNTLAELDSTVSQYEGKTLLDLLYEVVSDISQTEKHGIRKQLPKKMCQNCIECLKSAYDFIMQVRQTHSQFVNDLNTSLNINIMSEISETTAQFVPLPEPIILQESTDIVLHGELSVDPLNFVETNIKAEHTITNIDNLGVKACCDMDEIPLEKRETQIDTPTTSEKATKKSIDKPLKCQLCDKAYYWKDNLKNHMRIHAEKSEWYECEHCKRKFCRNDGLKAHLRKKHAIFDSTKRNSNEKRYQHNVDPNLCKPHGAKNIQCMICLKKFTKINLLRQHLNAHIDDISLTTRTETLNELAELFFPNWNISNEVQLIARIREHLKAGKLEYFAAISNSIGYELTLDSSETESEIDIQQMESDKKFKHICELCKLCFHRKYKLFEHQNEAHTWEEAPYSCVRCKARFLNKKLLQHHYEAQCKNIRKRYVCKKCPLKFAWKHTRSAHYNLHKSEPEILKCTECTRFFECKKSLTVHKLKDHGDVTKHAACKWCDRKFYRRDYLLKHLKQSHELKEQDIPLAESLLTATTKAHGVKKNLCKICGSQFKFILDLNVHLQLMHKSLSPSNYSITNEAGYELHIFEDSDSDNDDTMKTHICGICQVQCQRKYDLMKHQYAMHPRADILPYRCKHCIFKCVSEDILSYHEKSQCLNTDKENVCNVCGYKFMFIENLERHIKLQHQSQQAETTLIQENSNKSSATNGTIMPTILECPHCDRTYVQQSRLNNHIQMVHVEGDRKKKETKKYLCSHCGHQSKSAADLVTHIRQHTGEKPFKCEQCDMAFSRHYGLMCHMRKHTGEKPYQCTICKRNFPRSDKLRRHMLTHSGLKPHKCTFCDNSFRYSQQLKQHIQQHTGKNDKNLNSVSHF